MSMHPSDPNPVTSRSASATFAALIIFILCIAATEFMLLQERQHQMEEQRLNVTSRAGEVRAILEGELNASLHLTSGLISYIQARQGQLTDSEVDPWLSGLIKQGRHIRNIGLAPGNKITYIQPRAGNEAALGLYYQDNPLQWPAVEQAIRERHPILAGPVQLKQGGSGFIYRIPVFLAPDVYWGMVSTVINADELLKLVTQAAHDRGLHIALTRAGYQGPGSAKTVITGSLDQAQTVTQLQVTIPGGQWLLSAAPLNPGGSRNRDVVLRSIGWSIAAIMAVLIFLLMNASARRAAVLEALSASQQRFTRAFETAPQGMALLDLRDRCLDANDALCQLLGYSREELRGMRLSALVQPEGTHPKNSGTTGLIPNNNQIINQELRLLNKSGELIDCHLSVAMVTSKPAYLIAQIQDIRERKRLERMKKEFVSTVSHELRTPLTSIAGSLGLITGGALGEVPAPMQQMLDIAHQNSLRLGQLINDLLDMDKLAAGKMHIELVEQPLQPLLEQAITSYQSYAEKYHVTFRLTDSSSVHVRVDSMRLQQVLANLLSNAAKFSPAGSTVAISIKSDDNKVRVAVSDTGPGIPEEFRYRIFQKFSQADATDSRHRGGTGLGLAISKELIQHMGGSVGFESTLGAGSTFWFELPRHRPSDPDATPQYSTPGKSA